MRQSEDYHKIRNDAKNHKLIPRDQLWNRIEHKLKESSKEGRRTKFIRLRFVTAIAASFIVLIAFASLFYLNGLNTQNQYSGEVKTLEELKYRTDYFYSVGNARKAQQNFPYFADSSVHSLEGAALLPFLFRNDPI